MRIKRAHACWPMPIRRCRRRKMSMDVRDQVVPSHLPNLRGAGVSSRPATAVGPGRVVREVVLPGNVGVRIASPPSLCGHG